MAWQQLVGILVGAAFGVVFVLANAQAPLPSLVVVVVRGAALLGLVSVLLIGVVAVRRGAPRPRRTLYGRRFWRIVVAEIVLLVGGLQVLRRLQAPVEMNVAWIAWVVGLHFLAFGALWRDRGIAVVGAVQALLGLGGLALAATPAAGWVPLLSGVLSGVVLLAGSLGVVTTAARSST